MQRLVIGLGMVALAGCPGNKPVDTGDSGADADSGADSGSDSGADSGSDSGADSGSDSGADSGSDSGADSGSDSGADSGTTASELCNGVDDDGDGLVDDDDPDLVDGTTVYEDADGDGYGDPGAPRRVCEPSADDVTNSEDCDDTRAECNPGARGPMDCEALTDCDCDGVVDHECDWYELPVVDVGSRGSYLGLDFETGMDVTGDGVNDLVAGAPTYSGTYGYEGRLYIYAGPIGEGTGPSAYIDSYDAYGGLAYSVALGDFDGDGVGDAAYSGPEARGGAPGSGRGFITYGPLTSDSNMDDAAWIVQSTEDYANIAAGLAPGGDLDGDGQEDILIGSPNYGEGAVFLFNPGSGGAEDIDDYDAGVYTNRAEAGVGPYIASGRDFDGDGQSDLVLGAPGVDGGVGEARVYFGPLSGLQTWGSADFRVAGTGSDANIGQSVWALDDLDGDGLPELFLGRKAGAVLFSPTKAADLQTTDAWLEILPSADRYWAPFYYPYGSAITADMDGDGAVDIVVGNSGTDADWFGFFAILLSPVSSGVLLSDAVLYSEGQYNYEGMGDQNRSLGDQDGDGRAEVVTTNYTYDGFGYMFFIDGATVR